MKKFILLFSLLSLWSCSREESANQSNQDQALKPVQEKEYYIYTGTPTDIRIHNTIYSGNKIVKTVSGNDERRFFYTNDLITRGEDYQNNVLTGIDRLVYNSASKLTEYTSYSVTGGVETENYKEVITYNTDGTANLVSRNSALTEYFKFYFDSSGNVIKEEQYADSTYSTIRFTSLMTYDNKYTPEKNVLGMDKVNFIYTESYAGVTNNRLTHNLLNKNFVYEYNTSGYPIKITENGRKVTEFIYE